MPDTPTTKYAKSGDVHIAYQVVGDGPNDLVFVPGWVSHVEYAWEDPFFSHFLRRLASFSRLIILDRRGTGLSDRVADLPTLEQRMDDVRAVMDAAGSERAALFGVSEGGPMCLVFAATYPERTSALALYGTFARLARAPDYPIGAPSDATERFLQRVEAEWGTGSISAELFAPGHASDASFRQSWARFEMPSAPHSSSPFSRGANAGRRSRAPAPQERSRPRAPARSRRSRPLPSWKR
jgi:pimeloyl-ACP methyl ester carboxylesterase